MARPNLRGRPGRVCAVSAAEVTFSGNHMPIENNTDRTDRTDTETTPYTDTNNITEQRAHHSPHSTERLAKTTVACSSKHANSTPSINNNTKAAYIADHTLIRANHRADTGI